MADDDAFLGVALYIDDGIDVDEFVFLLETLHTHLYRIGYLLVVVAQYLLTNDFRHKEAGGFVGELVFVEKGGTLGQQLLNALQQNVYAKLVFGGEGKDLGFR